MNQSNASSNKLNDIRGKKKDFYILVFGINYYRQTQRRCFNNSISFVLIKAPVPVASRFVSKSVGDNYGENASFYCSSFKQMKREQVNYKCYFLTLLAHIKHLNFSNG